ncbi:hypothetical protein C0J52_01041 [Blattella germanica]|nr:hypothetical protein C0J52_01041 [Blattella germanica]
MKRMKSRSKSVQQFVPLVSEKKWREIEELEDRDNLVLQIREEIVSNTLEKCYDRYLARQVIKFAVHCSCIAWEKLLNVYFMQHDSCLKVNKGNIVTDIPPSPPDTWKANTVKILEEVLTKQVHESEAYISSHVSATTASELEVDEIEEIEETLPPLDEPLETTNSQIEIPCNRETSEEMNISPKKQTSDALKSLKAVTLQSSEVHKVISEGRPHNSLKQHRPQHSSFSSVYICPSSLPPSRLVCLFIYYESWYCNYRIYSKIRPPFFNAIIAEKSGGSYIRGGS